VVVCYNISTSVTTGVFNCQDSKQRKVTNQSNITLYSELSSKQSCIFYITALGIISIAQMFTGNSALLENNVPVIESSSTETTTKADIPLNTKDIVIQYYKETPMLVEVAKCESSLTHYTASGEVLRGKVDSRDIGVMQINEYYHRNTAEKLGLDIETLEGNLEYGQYLYNKQGLQPWSASSKCWSKALHVASN